MNVFLVVFAVAIIVEVVTEYLKKAVPFIAEHNWAVYLTSFVLAELCAINFNADFFALLGLESRIPYCGVLLTGLCCSGGSGMIYDILRRIQDMKGE